MQRFGFLCAAALAAATLSGPVHADDPYEKLTPEELARDKATIRRLNREQLDYVRKRDAQYARGWRAYDDARRSPDYGESRYARQMRDYESDRRDYERAMADWREDVAACRAGYYSRCRR